MLNYGSFIISLDFEMMWGCHDWSTPEGYGKSNINQVRAVISRILALFSKYEIHATFATVGMIMCKDTKDLERYIPKAKPSYLEINYSPYKGTYIAEIKKKHTPMYFAPDVIKKLQSTKGIEIGSHTFCHYFCWEKGQTPEQFKADLESAKAVAKDNGIELHSIVFPKNQVSQEYLNICKKEGITAYRGNAVKYFSEPKNSWEDIKNRICRLLDAYLNIGGMTGVPYSEITMNETPMNLRASRMLRPFSPKLSFLESLRLRRIKQEMIYAAKNHDMYHLWWHPHNFGAKMEQNLSFLEEVLKCYKECHTKYGMQSYTMNEMRETLITNQKN